MWIYCIYKLLYRFIYMYRCCIFMRHTNVQKVAQSFTQQQCNGSSALLRTRKSEIRLFLLMYEVCLKQRELYYWKYKISSSISILCSSRQAPSDRYNHALRFFQSSRYLRKSLYGIAISAFFDSAVLSIKKSQEAKCVPVFHYFSMIHQLKSCITYSRYFLIKRAIFLQKLTVITFLYAKKQWVKPETFTFDQTWRGLNSWDTFDQAWLVVDVNQ